jgi:dihydropteroate synthase
MRFITFAGGSQMIWRTKNREIDLTSKALIMGILNVTVDSFSDGGKFLPPEAAVDHALRMVEEGADIIDVGGESTRPGADPVPAEVELERVLPVIEALAQSCHSSTAQSFARGDVHFLISIDTSKAAVARAAIAAGASIINDVTGLRGDPAMIDVAKETGAGVVIMHMQGTPRTMQEAPHYNDVVAEVREFFRQSLARAISSGIDPMCIAFDPGIGFGKSTAHNLQLLKNPASLRIGGRPLLFGVSRKSFIGRLLGTDDMAERDVITAVLTGLLRERGADILRVHEVRRNVQSLRMTEAIGGNP